MRIISTKYGKMRIIDSDKIVSHALALYGEWAMDELNLLEKIITPGMHVMDIGAFIGTHSLAFASFVGAEGKVYAFEPRKEISEILGENIRLNDISNIIVNTLGLGKKAAELKITTLDLSGEQNFGGFSLVNEKGTGAENFSTIFIATIDSLNIDRVDVIKLDVEGMEHEVLYGATTLIEKNRPVIFCECNSVHAGNAILESIKEFQYEIFGFLSSAYNPENFNQNVSNIFGDAKELALLLLPREKSVELIKKFGEYSLPAIRSLDDLVLLMLHKPQYAYEVLATTSAAGALGLDFPSPAIHTKERQLEQIIQQAREDACKEANNLRKQIAFLQSALLETQMEASKQIEDLSGRIALLGVALAEEREQAAVRETSIKELSQHVSRADQSIHMLQKHLDEKERDLKESRESIGQRDEMLRRLTTSKSWAVTKPIRWTGRVMRGDMHSAMDPFRRYFKARHIDNADPMLHAAELVPEPTHYLDRSPIKRIHPVAVILPVYRGVDMTRRCIQAAMPGVVAVPKSRMIVINDGSPDAGMQEMLESLQKAQPDLITVLKNEKNLGFVGTVNRGFASAKECDTVLLNSDVMVPENWLSRMIDEAYSRPDVGTVTPLSNNGTICSFPQFLQENPQPFGLDVNTIDAVFRQRSLGCIEAPTGVGFCMYIRRSCLDQIGYLNQEKFGRGYGEENDLCQRAKVAGWLNIITPNIYAYHEGGVSFSSEKQLLVERAMKILDELHPSYHANVQAFIRADPVKAARVARYVQLLASLPIPKVLHISHALGGGVAQHVKELPNYSNKVANLILTPYGEKDDICIRLGVDQCCDKVIFNSTSSFNGIVSLLKNIGINTIHFHHILGLPASMLSLGKELQVPHLLTVHDFYLLNANPTLTDENGVYPGHYSDDQKNPLYPLPADKTVAEWQSQFREFVETAAEVIYPSNSTKAIFEKVYRPKNSVVAPHVEPLLAVKKIPHPFEKKVIYTVGVVGAIGREKGADLLEQMAGQALQLGLPLKFKLIGYAYRPLKLVETTGPYDLADLQDLIQRADLDVVLFPARWPETYSYTLSYALDAGLPVFAPNVGAFPERLSGRSNTVLFSYQDNADSLVAQINRFVEEMEDDRSPHAPNFERDESDFHFYESRYYALISKGVRNLPAEQTVPFFILPDAIVSGAASDDKGWREKLLQKIWSIYMNPSMRWIGQSIPFGVKRAVKRSLSRNAMHDIRNEK